MEPFGVCNQDFIMIHIKVQRILAEVKGKSFLIINMLIIHFPL